MSEEKVHEVIEKKVHEDIKLVAEMNNQMLQMQRVIENMDTKRGKIFIDWLSHQNKYLVWEETFNPLFLKKYKRGEVILANFGFNVGSEFGGMHYAVVIKKDKKSNPLLNVIPLSSLKEEQTQSDLHHEEVYLGAIEGINEKEAFAISNQIRPISKIRVFRPKKTKDDVVTLSDTQLDAIDEMINKIFTK